MFARFSVNFAVLSIIIDTMITIGSLYFSNQVRTFFTLIDSLHVPLIHPGVPTWMYICIPILWIGVSLTLSVYDPKRTYKAADEFQNVIVANAFASLVLAGLLFFAFREFSRWLFLSFVLLNIVFTLFWRVLARLLFKLGRLPINQRRVLIVGAGEVGERMGEILADYRWTGLQLSGFLDDDLSKQNTLPILGKLEDVRSIVQKCQIDDVIVALPQRAYSQVNKLIWMLRDLPVNTRIIPDYFSLAVYRATVDEFGGIPMINLRDPALNEVQRLIKRMFDLCLSGFVILCTLPLMLVIALIIKIDSGGPVFFRQYRAGENGRLFTMYKFRSMIVGAEALQNQFNEVGEHGEIIHKRRDDPRVTRVGRFLRRTSLDELPQLLNVLKGDMSLVGPRPELPWLLDKYEPWQRKRFSVPQGMTGWWQVNGRADKIMHKHTEDDLYYIQNYSLWMDIYILLKTPWVVLRGRGAY